MDVLRIGEIMLAKSSHTLLYKESAMVLRPLEFELLWFLGAQAGRLWPRDTILKEIWGDTSGIPTRAVDVQVVSLRKKLAKIGSPVIIASVQGVGYRCDV